MYDEIMNVVSQTCARISQQNPDDYVQDGLLYCGNCHTPKQVFVPFMERIEYCDCQCRQEEYALMWRKIRAMSNRSETEAVRDACFPEFDRKLHNSRFDFDDGRGDRQIFQRIRNYAESFPERLKENKGFLLYGNSGVGKTFLAACVANHVIDNGYTAMFTSISRVKNLLWDAKNKQSLLDSFASYDLLIIDDFGLEAKNDYTNENATQLIDIRCNSGKPMIITSNLRPDGLQPSADRDRERILSRILGNCVPILCVGDDRRRNHFRR